MPSRPLFPRLVLAGFVVLALGACGRRGALEPPPDPSAPQKPAAEVEEGTVPSPIGTPRRTASPRTPYEKPKQPFILDPLL